MNMTVARQAYEAKDIALAAWANSAATVQALLSDGIAADTPPKSGSFAGRRFTALHMAAWNANTQMVRLLLDHDADPCARDDNGKTPAERALDLAHNYHAGIPLARVIETIDILVGRGASLRIADENGDSLLHQLCERGHTGYVELVRFLLEHEVDKDAKNKSGKTPLHQAAGYGDAAVVGALIEHGADVNAMDNEGNTPLMSAAERGYEFVTVTLPNGRNVLQKGSATGRLDCVILLLAAGTNVAARNRAGNTAADIARAKEHLDVLTVLEKPTPTALTASVDAQPATDGSLLNAVGATLRLCNPVHLARRQLDEATRIIDQEVQVIAAGDRSTMNSSSDVLRALALLEESIALCPKDLDLLVAKACVLQAGAQFKSAEEVLDVVLSKAPDHFEARMWKSYWESWMSAFQFPPWSEQQTGLHPVMLVSLRYRQRVQLVRDGLQKTLAIVSGVQQLPLANPTQIKVKWIPSQTPYGPLMAYYLDITEASGKNDASEAFVYLARPTKYTPMEFLIEQLVFTPYCYVVVVDRNNRVIYNRRTILEEEVRQKVSNFVSRLSSTQAYLTPSQFQNAGQWHQEHFDMERYTFK